MKKFKFLIAILSMLVLLSSDNYKSPQYKLIIFEGSDWCANCRRLENNILKDSSFLAFLNDNAIELEKIDFPQRKKISKEQKKYNEAIAEKYSFEGLYPTIIISRTDILSFEEISYSNQTVQEMKVQIQQKIEKLK